MKPATARAYHPGDLVYYKRHQAPAEGRSHQKLDVPRRQVARWYGPARILGLETKVTYSGQVRQPHRLAWIISQGRLKRVHTDQLRYASEREKLTNEEFHDVLATPWTFTDVTSILDKGSYDDLIELPHLQRGRPHDVKPRRSPSRGRAGQSKRPSSTTRARSAPATKPKTEEVVMDQQPPERPPSEGYSPSLGEEFMPQPLDPGQLDPAADQDLPPVPSDNDLDLEDAADVDLDRLLDDPHYMPRMEPGPPSGPLFQHKPFQRSSPSRTRRSSTLEGPAGAWCSSQCHVDARGDLRGQPDLCHHAPYARDSHRMEGDCQRPGQVRWKQVAKGVEAAYGLTIAPREFYMMVNDVLERLKLRRLKTDPCVWQYVVEEDGKPKTLGMIGSHVDDFLMTGYESDPRWIDPPRAVPRGYALESLGGTTFDSLWCPTTTVS
eukprot:s815_g32.t1